MFGICLRYSKDYTEAEDISQEGFVKVFQNIRQYKNEGHIENWMKRIMINTALERFRMKKSITMVPYEQNNDTEDLSSENIINIISAGELMKCIQELPPQYRTVFNLYAIDGYKHEEIGQLLKINTGTSKSNLSRARQILQKRVEELYEAGLNNVVKKSC